MEPVWMLLVTVARRPRCPATTMGERRGTRELAIQLIRRRSRRSSRSCAQRARGLTVLAYAL